MICCLFFVQFHPMCMKFGTGDVHKNVLIDWSFVKIDALKVIIYMYIRAQVNVLCLPLVLLMLV